jgi:hypothetical protein
LVEEGDCSVCSVPFHCVTTIDAELSLGSRFTKLASSSSLAPAKKDEITIKRNILGSFAKRTFDEAAEAVKAAGSVVGEATKSVHSVFDQATEAVKQEL